MTLLERFVGDKYASYYGPLWDAKQSGWNLPAFIFSLGWMAYRKMYTYCFIYMAFVSLANLGLRLIHAPDLFGRLLTVTLSAIIGMSGNQLYQQYSMQRCARIRRLPLAEQEKALQREGGTSWLGAIGMVALNAVLLFSPLLWALFFAEFPKLAEILTL